MDKHLAKCKKIRMNFKVQCIPRADSLCIISYFLISIILSDNDILAVHYEATRIGFGQINKQVN